MITVSHITKRFGAVNAVNDVSFSINEGEVVGLLGPNGAGKTTTMRMMTGYYEPDAGEVVVNGINVSSDPMRARREIGYLPESNPLYKDMLVEEYLTFVARMRDVPRTSYRSVFDRVVADTGIAEVFYRPISELSKGYRQRVGLASALIGDPKVLILDEPTEGLDPNQRNDMRALLARLAKSKTILISTHVISEVQATADRVIVLRGGSVAAIGTIAEVTAAKSRDAHFTLGVSGKRVVEALRSLSSVRAVEVVHSDASHDTLTVHTNDASLFPPEFSKLVGSHHFVIWSLTPETGGLERAFADLTLGLSGDTDSTHEQ